MGRPGLREACGLELGGVVRDVDDVVGVEHGAELVRDDAPAREAEAGEGERAGVPRYGLIRWRIDGYEAEWKRDTGDGTDADDGFVLERAVHPTNDRIANCERQVSVIQGETTRGAYSRHRVPTQTRYVSESWVRRKVKFVQRRSQTRWPA